MIGFKFQKPNQIALTQDFCLKERAQDQNL